MDRATPRRPRRSTRGEAGIPWRSSFGKYVPPKNGPSASRNTVIGQPPLRRSSPAPRPCRSASTSGRSSRSTFTLTKRSFITAAIVGVLERLVRHHVAPVAGGVADREQDRLVLGAGARRTPPRPRGTSRPGCRRAGGGTGWSRRRGGSRVAVSQAVVECPSMGEARRRSRFTDPAIDEYSAAHSTGPDRHQVELQEITLREDRRSRRDADRRRPGRADGDHRAPAMGAKRAVEVGTFTGYSVALRSPAAWARRAPAVLRRQRGVDGHRARRAGRAPASPTASSCASARRRDAASASSRTSSSTSPSSTPTRPDTPRTTRRSCPACGPAA